MRFNLMPPHAENRHGGFTVVELMIAVAIAAILMLGVIQTFVMSKHTYKLSDALARAQENARYAVSYLSREIRMAGYTGCRATNLVNILNFTPGDWRYDFDTPIQGWEGGVSTFPSQFASKVVPGTDAFVVLRGSDSPYQIVSTNATPAASIILTGSAGLSEGDIVIATDCQQATIFQITSPVSSNTITHSANSGTTTPGNCTKMMGYPRPLVCTATGGTQYYYQKNASLLKMTSTAYYIGQSNSGNGNALFRMTVNQGTVGSPEELVDGIEDMQVLYGVDTNLGTAGDNGLATKYITADKVATLAHGFLDVVSVRLGLLVDTVADNVTRSKDNQTYTIADTSIVAGTTGTHVHPKDYKLRFPITTTIKLRNRGAM